MPVNLLDKPMYWAWVAMRRNTSPNVAPHIRRLYDGISVCPEWREDYDAFQEWSFANGWEKGLRLTRKDKKGDFCPENCFWTTLEEANGWRSVVHHIVSSYGGFSAGPSPGPRFPEFSHFVHLWRVSSERIIFVLTSLLNAY